MIKDLILDRCLAIFERDTAGTDLRNQRILKISILMIAPGCDPGRRASAINPGIPIPPAATEIHGIRDEDVAGMPPFANWPRRSSPPARDATLALQPAFDPGRCPAACTRAGRTFPMDGRPRIDPCRILFPSEPTDPTGATRFCSPADG